MLPLSEEPESAIRPGSRARTPHRSPRRGQRSGAALVLRGEPGIGKSRLLAEAMSLAGQRNMSVLATRGVQSEARLAFAGLQQLLRPVRSHAAGLSPAHRSVLDAALGIGDEHPPEHFRIALAVLDLLSEAAAARRCS